MRLLAGLLLLVLISGCGEEVPRPAVEPLSATQEALSALYGWGGGPHKVESQRGLSFELEGRDRVLRYNAWFPAGEDGPWPLLLFSHGNWSTNDKYDRLIEHWTSHGYVVLAPLHMDGAGGYLQGTINMLRYGNLGLIQARVDDLVALLDHLDVVQQQVPALAGRIDSQRVAATGHSFGAFNAQQLGGAAAFDSDEENWVNVRDERIRAVVAVSPPGPMFDEIADGSWDQQTVPTLMTTGTWDTNAMFWPDWRMHMLSWETAQPGSQYALVVQGADHYLGNLICRPELDEPPQHDALAMVNTATVAFLNAYLKEDATALDFLRSGQLSSVTAAFAQLDIR